MRAHIQGARLHPGHREDLIAGCLTEAEAGPAVDPARCSGSALPSCEDLEQQVVLEGLGVRLGHPAHKLPIGLPWSELRREKGKWHD